MAGSALRRVVSSHYAQVGYDINALVISLFAFSGLHASTGRRSIPERARVADGDDDQLRLKPLTHRALPNAFEQQYYENLRSVLDFIS
jgi:hypothetical protein